jgi:polar amino acid transport system substrate-binding protein
MSRTVSLSVAAALLLAVAGCSNSTSEAASTSQKTGSESLIPADFADKPLVWASAANQPPAAFTSADGKPTGIDFDLAQGLQTAIGHEINYTTAPFANNVLGLDAGRVDIVADAAPNASRLEKYDIVAVYNTAYGVAVKNDSPAIDGSNADNLCGHSVSTNAGGYIIPVLKQKSEACTAAGKEPIDIQEFPDGTACGLAVQSGRVDAWFGTFPSQQYAASQAQGDWQVSLAPWAKYTNSLMVKKGTGLAEALATGMDTMIQDGSYHDAMAKYGLEQLELEKSIINPES